MANYKIDNEIVKSEIFPEFSIVVNDSHTTAIYSDVDMQAELVKELRKTIAICDRQDGLYDRLTIKENVAFYRKWFGCKRTLSEILVLFNLHNCAEKPLKNCSSSEFARVHYAKHFMTGGNPSVFLEPIHGIDILTINTFIEMLKKLTEEQIPVLVLVSNMEHALLLGDVAYRLHQKGANQIEIETEEESTTKIAESSPTIANLFKIPAKVEDKVILFDPPEIDYIESQDGKSKIVINDESFAMDSTLAEIEKKLEVYGFYRCHRSYIVNLQKVREIITWSKNTYSLKLDNKIQSTIPLSRTKLQDIQDIFNLK